MENEEGEEMIVAHLNQDDFTGEIGVFFLKSLIEL